MAFTKFIKFSNGLLALASIARVSVIDWPPQPEITARAAGDIAHF